MSRSSTIESADSSTWASPVLEDEPDCALLGRFVTDRDERLVRDPGVAADASRPERICRSWLGPGQDAEDAFQATFLVLADRARAIRRSGSLDAWLCVVARRVAGRGEAQGRTEASPGGGRRGHQPGRRSRRVRRPRSPAHPARRGRPPAGEVPQADRALLLRSGLGSEEAADRLRLPYRHPQVAAWPGAPREILRRPARPARRRFLSALLMFWIRPARAEADGPHAVGPDARRTRRRPRPERPSEGQCPPISWRRRSALVILKLGTSRSSWPMRSPPSDRDGQGWRRGWLAITLPSAVLAAIFWYWVAAPWVADRLFSGSVPPCPPPPRRAGPAITARRSRRWSRPLRRLGTRATLRKG